MTYRQKYDKSKTWQKKVIVMNLFHQYKMYHNGNVWNVRRTAAYFGVSIGLVSENVRIGRMFNVLKDCKNRMEAVEKMKESWPK